MSKLVENTSQILIASWFERMHAGMNRVRSLAIISLETNQSEIYGKDPNFGFFVLEMGPRNERRAIGSQRLLGPT